MERLTKRTPLGPMYTLEALIIGDPKEKLAQYEDTEMIPEDINNMHKNYLELQKNYQSTISELEEYKDLEKQGLLIKLPCKVGDRVYQIVGDEIESLIVGNFILNGISEIALFIKNDGKTFNDYTNLFGEMYFLTKEEAEKALGVEQ